MKESKISGSLWFVLGAVLATCISLLVYNRALGWDLTPLQFRGSLDLLWWRMKEIGQVVCGLTAVYLAMRGRLRRALWWAFGYFLFEAFAIVIQALVYWP